MNIKDQKFALRTVYVSSLLSTIGVFATFVAMDNGAVTSAQFSQAYFLMAVLAYLLMTHYKIAEHKLGYYLIAMVAAPVTILSIIVIYWFYLRFTKSGNPDIRP